MNRLLAACLVSVTLFATLGCGGSAKPPKTVAYLEGEPVGRFSPRDGFVAHIYRFEEPAERVANELEVQLKGYGNAWLKTEAPNIVISYIRNKPFTIINVIDGHLTDDGVDIQPGTEGKVTTVTVEAEI